jgi:hypothetical protein
MIESIISRIEASISDFKLVGGSVQFTTNAERPTPMAVPACFVLVNAELPGPPAAANLLIQQVQMEIGIITVVRNVADVTGRAASLDTEQLRKKVKDLLYGWVPEGASAPLARGPGSLLAFRDGHVWWQDIYSTSYYDKAMQ